MSTMMQLIRDLAPIRSGTVCDGADQVMERLKQELPFTIHEFASGNECNGWVVPWKWECQIAMICDTSGYFIYDGNEHPLGVASYSDSFRGDVSGKVLKEHLFFSDAPGFEEEIIYHCDWWYKPHARSWGLCIPKSHIGDIYDDEMISVDLRTTFTPGTMKVAEYVLPGRSEQSIVINAHTCHPGCANDDLSGVAVGIEVMRFLATLPDRRYTYRLICAPEHYGSIFYLDRFGSDHIAFALFLESLGSTGPLALQHSFTGDAMIDLALLNVLRGESRNAQDKLLQVRPATRSGEPLLPGAQSGIHENLAKGPAATGWGGAITPGGAVEGECLQTEGESGRASLSEVRIHQVGNASRGLRPPVGRDVALPAVPHGTSPFYVTGEFRSIVGNDETVWDSAGHEVPCPSLSRCPFPEYHTSRDNPDLMDAGKLEEAVQVVSQALVALETDATLIRQFEGLVCLSNPDIDLYKPYFDPSIPDRRTIDAEATKWNRLMNHLPRYFDGRSTLIELAEKFEVKYADLYDYVLQWSLKGLVELHEPETGSSTMTGRPIIEMADKP